MTRLTDEQIESVIDAHGLDDLLVQISLICDEKADHIRVNWQDKVTAKPWAKMAKRIESLARQAAALEL